MPYVRAMTSPDTLPAARVPHPAVQALIDDARGHGFTIAALCAAATPPLVPSQVSRWLNGQEPRQRQYERLKAALDTLKARR
jgi:hypothetical protein